MRKTLIVLVTGVAFMLPATAASAAEAPGPSGTNASCSNGKGGNYAWTLAAYNGKGNTARAAGACAGGAGGGVAGGAAVAGGDQPQGPVT